MMRCMYFSQSHLLCRNNIIYDISTGDYYRKLLTMINIKDKSMHFEE